MKNAWTNVFHTVFRWNIPNCSPAAHRIQRDTNFKHKKSRVCNGSFLLDVLETNLKCLSFTTAKKLVFPWERAPTKIKIITTSLPNFTEFYRRKREIHCQFCFLCPCWRHKRFPSSTRTLLELSSTARVTVKL